MANRLKIPHTFVLHTYTKPTKCHFCNKLLVGVIKQGVQCKVGIDQSEDRDCVT